MVSIPLNNSSTNFPPVYLSSPIIYFSDCLLLVHFKKKNCCATGKDVKNENVLMYQKNDAASP